MESVAIEPQSIEFKKNDLNSFFEVPFKIYPDFPHISYLKSDLERFFSLKNPLFRSKNDFAYYTALCGGQIVGRILCHIHHASNEQYKVKRAYFGYFDCINDISVAKALLTKAEDFGRSRGCDELAGNFNMTAMQAIGVVTKIHRRHHYTDQVFSPEYIADLLKKCGYEAFFPMVTHETDIQNFNAEGLLGEKQKEILNNPDFSLEELHKVNLEDIIEAMRICLNNGFSDNPMFVPLVRDEIYFQAKDMMLILDRYISIIAKYKGQPVGTIVCIPNLNPLLKDIKSRFGLSTLYYFIKHKMKRHSAIIIYYSVFKEFHSQGLNGVMLYKVMTALKKRGYKTLGGTWISTDNKPSIRQAEKVGAQIMHELCLFKKTL